MGEPASGERGLRAPRGTFDVLPGEGVPRRELGRIAEEVLELAHAGLPAVEALSAACWSARSWLGRDGLGEGASADLLVLDGDPREDLRVLLSPAAVVLRGAVRAGRWS